MLSWVFGKLAADTSLLTRLTVWKACWRAFLLHPWLGYGQESVLPVLMASGVVRPYADNPYDRAHNIILEWLVSAGALGLLAYLSLFVIGITIAWHRGREGRTLIALLGGYFVYLCFNFDTLMSYVLFFTVLAYLASEAVQKKLCAC